MLVCQLIPRLLQSHQGDSLFTQFLVFDWNDSLVIYYYSITPPTPSTSSPSQSEWEAPAAASSSEKTEYKSPILTHLRTQLTTLRNLRHGFIEQHGSEPSVSLKYSEQSTSNSTISLRVGNELDRGNFAEEDVEPSTSTAGTAMPKTEEDKNDNVSYLVTRTKMIFAVFIFRCLMWIWILEAMRMTTQTSCPT